MTSCLYAGTVVHTRLRPHRHRLRYRMMMLMLELDEAESLSRRLWLFSAERFNLFSFQGRDHLAGNAVPLRRQVEAHLREAGLPVDGGAIRVLCMPRVLGGVFNPLSIFFCHAADGSLRAVLYEVNNTFGQRHSYLIPAADLRDGLLRQRCEKRFYVSPFMDMEMEYRFRIALPGERVVVGIEARQGGRTLLAASFAGEAQPLTDAALLRGFLRHPLMALQVLAGIHWEALKLWRKGLRLRPRPAPPAQPVSLVMPKDAA